MENIICNELRRRGHIQSAYSLSDEAEGMQKFS